MLVYILITANRGKVDYILEKIRDIAEEDNAKDIHMLYGEYDIIAKIKSQTEERMAQKIKQIRNVDGVQALKTFTVAHKTNETDILPK